MPTSKKTTKLPRDPEKEKAFAEQVLPSFNFLMGWTDEKGRPCSVKEIVTPSGAVRLVSLHVKEGEDELLREVRLVVREGKDIPIQDLEALCASLKDLFGFDMGLHR